MINEKTMVADALTGLNGELKMFGEMIPQTENPKNQDLLRASIVSAGNSHGEISAIEGNLHQCAIGDTHPEDFRECFYHRIGDIIGESPEGEAAGD